MFPTSIARRLGLAALGLGSVAAFVAAGPPTTPPQKGVGINIANIDPSVKPCEDFFHYASGNWLKNNPIPAAESRWGSFNELANNNNATLRAILNDAAKNAAKAPKGSNAQKVGDYYASAMDSMAIEAAGLKYLQPYLNRIAAIKDLGEMQHFLADPKAHTGSVWFGAGVGQDEKISSQYAVQFGQGGLTLADRDYYLKDDARSKAIRAAYQTYQVNIFKMLGDNEATATANAAAVQRIETRLAKASKSRVDLRDPYANYNKMTLAEADAAYPNLALPPHAEGRGIGRGQGGHHRPAGLPERSEHHAEGGAHCRPEAVPALAPGFVGDVGAAQSLRRRGFPLLAGDQRGQEAAAALEAHAGLDGPRPGRSLRPTICG